MEEQDVRIEARDWCGAIDTDRGASENQVENIAIHFYNKGKEELSQIEKELKEKLCEFDIGCKDENDCCSNCKLINKIIK